MVMVVKPPYLINWSEEEGSWTAYWRILSDYFLDNWGPVKFSPAQVNSLSHIGAIWHLTRHGNYGAPQVSYRIEAFYQVLIAEDLNVARWTWQFEELWRTSVRVYVAYLVLCLHLFSFGPACSHYFQHRVRGKQDSIEWRYGVCHAGTYLKSNHSGYKNHKMFLILAI